MEIDLQNSYEFVDGLSQQILSMVKCRPTIGIVCGSGIGGLSDLVEEKEILQYNDINGFPRCTVEGHGGEFVFGKLGGKFVVLMKGRFHFYEGYPIWRVAQPMRVFARLGVKTVVLTNAAGGLNPQFRVGDFMLLADHLNLPGMAGHNPLIGLNDSRWGPRFPPTSNIYNCELAALIRQAAVDCNEQGRLREGCYCFESGPTYESVAEAKYLRSIGADAVGMSTVPEAIVAHHCGLRVIALSLITNAVVMELGLKTVANHEEVLATGQLRATDFQRLIRRFLELLEN